MFWGGSLFSQFEGSRELKGSFGFRLGFVSEGKCSDLCVKRVSLGFLCERVVECERFVGSEMKFRVKRPGTRENSSGL